MSHYEYRVRPVVRYNVTRCTIYGPGEGGTGGVQNLGQFENEQFAEEVVESLSKLESQRTDSGVLLLGSAARPKSPNDLDSEIARMHKRLAEIKQRKEQIKSRNGIQSAPDQVGVRPVAQWIKPSDIPPGTGY